MVDRVDGGSQAELHLVAAVGKRDLTHSDDRLCGLIRPPRPPEDGRRISVRGWQADTEGHGPIGPDITPAVIAGRLSSEPIGAFRYWIFREREVCAVSAVNRRINSS